MLQRHSIVSSLLNLAALRHEKLNIFSVNSFFVHFWRIFVFSTREINTKNAEQKLEYLFRARKYFKIEQVLTLYRAQVTQQMKYCTRSVILINKRTNWYTQQTGLLDPTAGPKSYLGSGNRQTFEWVFERTNLNWGHTEVDKPKENRYRGGLAAFQEMTRYNEHCCCPNRSL